MSGTPRPIVTPGPTPQGPPGWEEKQQQRLASGDLTNTKQSSNFHDDIQEGSHTDSGIHSTTESHKTAKGPLAGLKEKVHHIGEKMSLVPPIERDEHGNAMERSAHTQDASTMPE
ncbi:hypothetical protein CBS101457_005818 [Exobasidium rhododendri]|nr:hypothetical protein CBS101457_005818 [Exobasidium rhododendri]